MTRGLFLDLDGTLADSVPLLRQVYHEFLGRFGRAGSGAEFDALNGPPAASIVARLEAAHALPGGREALLALYRELVAAAHAAAPPMAGARELLVQARARHWAVAVVTSAAQAEARRWLARAGLEAQVAAVVGGDEVGRGKPDPEPYRLALARTGADAATSLAVEDSAHGAAAALAAGVPTYLLGPGAATPADPNYRGRVLGLADLLPLL